MTKITTTGRTLESISDDVFVPNSKQREIKSAFWYSWSQGPSKGAPTIAAAVEITRCSAIESWAKVPNFKEWFFNDQSHGQRLEGLFDMGLDMLEEIMTTAEKAGDRLRAFEYVAKLSQKLNKPETEIRYLDKDIQDMDLEKLGEVIKQLGGANDEQDNK